MSKQYDLAIIGAGVTGLAAGMYAGRLGLTSIILGTNTEFEKPIGGVITTTDVVENYPGFSKLTGEELAQKLHDHAMDYKDKLEIKEARVEKIIKADKDFHCFRIQTKEETLRANAIIIATGTRWRRLPMPGAKEFESRGVSYCALCDGPLFRNKIIGVIGGSDSAAKESLFLAKHAKKVYIFNRSEKIRPEPVNAKLVAKTPNIEVINNINVTEIRGDKLVNEIELDREINGSTAMKIDGIFGAIGHIPITDLAKEIGVELNEGGYIKINRKSETNLKGVYAAGDVVDTDFKQAIVGVAEGVTAAHSAFTFVQANEFVCPVEDPQFEKNYRAE
jgi:thioredoxin reductase (NADPH)